MSAPALQQPLSPRRRGGQPGNSNARTHGLYATRPAAPSGTSGRARADFFRSLPPSPYPVPPGSGPAADPRLLTDQLGLYRLTLDRILGIALGPLPAPELGAWTREMLRISSRNRRLVLEHNRLQGYPGILSALARDIPRLVNREFRRCGIPEHTLFVPLEFGNFDMNSSAGGPVLTDAQWLLLSDTLETLQKQLDSSRTYRRHKPRPHPRLLMEGILLKLALAVRWRDLPRLFHRFHPHAPAFPLRAARRLYRQLFLSGRLAGIYSQLAWHLAVYGGATPGDLVERGVFQLIPGRTLAEPARRARLAPGQRLTWQKFTALLLLQRALFNQRALRRAQDLERRRRGLYLRLPSPRPPRFPACRSSPSKPSFVEMKRTAHAAAGKPGTEILRATQPAKGRPAHGPPA